MIRVRRTASTNADLRRMASEGAVHGTALLALEQTAGKGRLGRSWLAAPGQAVLLSVLVRRSMPATRVPLLTLGAAVAVAEAVDGLGIKWPNDLLAPDGRKVCGILADAEFGGGRLESAVVGIGLNVHGHPDLPAATSLAEVFPDRDYALDDLAGDLVSGLLDLVEILERDPAAVLERWRGRSATLGRRVRIEGIEGTAVDIDASGALLVDTGASIERMLAGDVHHRP